MGKDFLGKRLDATIDGLVGFVFETVPYLMITLAMAWFLYKLLRPIFVIVY